MVDVIQVECECGRVIKTNDENAGRKARCPECGGIVRIPSPKAAPNRGNPSRSRGRDRDASNKSNRRKIRRPPASNDDEFDIDDLPIAEYADDEFDELPPPRRTRQKTASADPPDDDCKKRSPKKKKKNANAGPESSNSMLIVASIIGGVAFFAVGIVVIVMFVSSGKSGSATTASAPANEAVAVAVNAIPELEKFSTEQGELSCLAPKGWDIKSAGGTGGIPTSASFEKGKIKIQFRSSPSGTQIGAIAQAGNRNPQDLPESMRPVSVAHDYQKEKFTAEVAGYQESGEPQMFKTTGFGGEGRLSTFTASDGVFGKVYGYRATLLGNNHQWNVVCKCPAGEWKKYQSMFRQIMESASGN